MYKVAVPRNLFRFLIKKSGEYVMNFLVNENYIKFRLLVH